MRTGGGKTDIEDRILELYRKGWMIDKICDAVAGQATSVKGQKPKDKKKSVRNLVENTILEQMIQAGRDW